MISLIKKLVTIIIVLVVAISAKAQNLTQQIDEIVKENYKEDMPGAAILVAKNGKAIYKKAFGKANLELDVNMTTENVFQLASITKQFTAIAILMLEEQGKLKVEDEITKYIPDYPVKGKKITIHQLLNHTSGIRDYTSMPGLLQLARNDMKPTELIEYFKNEPMDFAPGEKYAYNNSAYILLGHIIEVVTKDTYENFIEQQIFKPLSMTNSRYGNMSEIIEKRASGYKQEANNYKNADYISLTLPYAGGSLMSTVDDMLKWQNALKNNTLLKKETFAKAIKPTILNSGEKIEYGYGLGILDLKGSKGYEHSGGIFGFTTNGLYLEKEDVYVIGLSNCSCNDIGSVTKKIAALAIGKPYPSVKDAIKLSENQLKKWVGAYAFAEGVTRYITFKDGQLFSQRDAGQQFAIYPLTKDHFIFDDVTISYHFSTDKNGKKQVQMITSDGENIGKETDKKAPAARKEITVAPKILQQYVGEYELQPGFSLVMTLENGKLFTQATGQQKFQLYAESETKFFLKVVEAKVEFVKDATGKFNSCFLYQNGLKMPAKRKK